MHWTVIALAWILRSGRPNTFHVKAKTASHFESQTCGIGTNFW